MLLTRGAYNLKPVGSVTLALALSSLALALALVFAFALEVPCGVNVANNQEPRSLPAEHDIQALLVRREARSNGLRGRRDDDGDVALTALKGFDGCGWLHGAKVLIAGLLAHLVDNFDVGLVGRDHHELGGVDLLLLDEGAQDVKRNLDLVGAPFRAGDLTLSTKQRDPSQ